MHVCFCCVRLRFSEQKTFIYTVYIALDQETVWEERLGNDLFCVWWDT